MNRKRITNLEERLESLIEGGFARMFRGTLQPRKVGVKLVRAIEDHTVNGPQDRDVAPTRYTIRLNPADYEQIIQNTPKISQQLAKQVITYCTENDLILLSTPVILLEADPAIQHHQLHIDASHASQKHETTQMLDPVGVISPFPPPRDSRLIIDDKRHVLLTLSVFNIGRHPDNDLVLSDLRVSRHHVQLQIRHGKYILYDLQSRGGTYVNGQQIVEHEMQSGDIIRIGNVTLQYEEYERQSSGIHDTQMDMLPPDLPEGS